MLKALKSKKNYQARACHDCVGSRHGHIRQVREMGFGARLSFSTYRYANKYVHMRHRKVTTKPKLRNAQDDTIKLKRACSMLCHKIGKRKWKKLRWWKNEEYQLWKSNAKNC
jgi:hypothetical protein